MKRYEKLAFLRKEKGLTQMELAEELNVSRQAVSRWETGTSIPTTENLACLSKLYQVPVDYLLNEDAERIVNEESVQERGMEDRPARGGNSGTKSALAAAALILLALVLGMWAGYSLGKADQNGEVFLYIEEMKGRKLGEPGGTFHLETGW